MRKDNPKYNAYLKRRLKRLERERTRKRQSKQKWATRNYDIPTEHFRQKVGTKENEIAIVVPERFSILENPEETIMFFNTLRQYITTGTRNKVLSFDFKKVSYMTIDALMYLVAIIRNTKFSSPYVKAFQGNMPDEKEPKDLFLRSGFLNYVQSRHKGIRPDRNLVQIFFDKSDSDTQAPKRIVDFIMKSAGVPLAKLRFLYEMIVELETNSHDHAYSSIKNNPMGCNWLAYAEDAGFYYRFTFLDIGVGMYKTMYREIREILRFWDTQSSCIISAFDGILLRSSTRLKTRGHGLPSIKETVSNAKIQNLQVMTNKAFCQMQGQDSDMVGHDCSNSLRGTIYYWEISKESLMIEENKGA